MSKQRQVKRRKRKVGYINLVKPSQFKFRFSSFAELANHFSTRSK
jgi:hypothetical protein